MVDRQRKGGEGMENLTSVKTCDLVFELQQREGVKKITAEPYEEIEVKTNGPAVILVIQD